MFAPDMNYPSQEALFLNPSTSSSINTVSVARYSRCVFGGVAKGAAREITVEDGFSGRPNMK